MISLLSRFIKTGQVILFDIGRQQGIGVCFYPELPRGGSGNLTLIINFCMVFLSTFCLLRLVVRTSGFHPDNRGSTPLGDVIAKT